ncbi:unnamed protein product [Gongylonema pulchrum]|uniref:Uncharacterized protein n=1 Tax=Gongylonema pulchrum TaxID=637853 RepID=A0A183DK76_9BILA|nr:unnamed protein product [Gongylonema pulchrum]
MEPIIVKTDRSVGSVILRENMVASESHKAPRDKDGSDISMSMSDALKSIFGEIVQKFSTMKDVA